MKKKAGLTNWDKLKNLSEDEIEKRANHDADALPVTKEELTEFKRVNPVDDIDVKGVREKLHLSQSNFAMYFGVSARTVQEWEQHRKKPGRATRNFLRVIEREPEAVQRALNIQE